MLDDLWREFWVASALMFIIEGLVPFASPKLTRHSLLMLAELDDNTLRWGGLACTLLGVGALYLA